MNEGTYTSAIDYLTHQLEHSQIGVSTSNILDSQSLLTLVEVSFCGVNFSAKS